MSAESIRQLLNPTSIAIVGASEASVWARELVQNILRWKFPGTIYMVNPKNDRVYGRPCYRSISAVPARIDHALIVVRASLVAGVLRDCVAAGVRSVTVIAAGFTESGASGAALAREAAQLCTQNGIEMIGPNCYGFINYPGRAVLARNWVEEELRASGRISMVFQSGQLSLSACGSAFQRGIDIRYMVSSGNELVTDSNDYFDYFIEDPGTRVLGGALERIAEPRRFEQLAQRALQAGKPIVLLKLGTSEVGSRIAASHTGSVAGAADIVNAFLRDIGVVVVADIDELMETAGLLDQRGWPRGRRAVFLGGSGGAGEFFADMADGTRIGLAPLERPTLDRLSELTGLPVAGLHNPLDLTASGFGSLPTVAPMLVSSEEIDILIAQGEQPLSLELQGADMIALVESHMQAFIDAEKDGIYPVFLSSADRAPTDFGKAVRRARGATYLRGRVGVRALHNAIAYGEERDKAAARIERLFMERDEIARAPRALPKGTQLSEFEAKHVLASYGVPVTQDIQAANLDGALGAAKKIGYPVVLKIDSPHVSHKSEIGGVIVGIANDEELCIAYQGVLSRTRAAYPEHHISSVIVCKQIDPGVEMIIGAVVDPAIGPMLMVGAGGIYVEILRDTVLALPPVDRSEAEGMLSSLKIWPLLEGVRGRAGVHLPSLIDTIVATSRMIATLGPRLVELDINPVVATSKQAVAVDALIILSRPT